MDIPWRRVAAAPRPRCGYSAETGARLRYRHYVLGHKHIPCDTADIYRKMISVRPHVSPAYEDILRGYEKYLKAGRR